MEDNKIRKSKNRENEKGAVMVMVLLISFLLLIASAGILLETSMNTANVSDATADQQAYNAAESGIQSAIYVLRKPDFHVDFKKAVTPSLSNADGDLYTEARLSRWMTYDYPFGSSLTDRDRITLGTTTAKPYTPQNGFAYTVSLSDPNRVGSNITYYTSGKIAGVADENRFPAAGNDYVKIKYNPVSTTDLPFSSVLPKATSFGSFTVTVNGSGGTIPDETRFEILVKMLKPYTGTKIIRGTINLGTITNASTVSLIFDSQVNVLTGSTITLDIAESDRTLTLNTNGVKNLTGTMTPVEPRLLLIRSTGYGPRGARKQLEAVVQKNYFNGLSAPAALTLVGSSNGFLFSPGNSTRVIYSGDDAAPNSNVNIPSIGVTNASNLNGVIDNSPKTLPNPPPSDVTLEMPDWLSDTAALDATVQELKNTAKASKSYYPSGTNPTNFGNSDGSGVIFADGDCVYDGSKYGDGGGILVVTGKLTFKGDINFNGLIIVTGAQGFERSGGGGGLLQGNTVIAPYDKTQVNNYKAQLINYYPNTSVSPPPPPDFLAPKYYISGGGNSAIRYNSSSVADGLNAVSNLVLGVAEK